MTLDRYGVEVKFCGNCQGYSPADTFKKIKGSKKPVVCGKCRKERRKAKRRRAQGL